MNLVSLFSGVGGLDLAAEWAGFFPAVFVERNSYCRRVLAKHWPGVPQFEDVREFNGQPFRGSTCLCGGFPCQDISIAGEGRGLGGERSGLWFEMLRIVSDVRPRFVVAENVSALHGRGIDIVIGGLEEAGYTVEALRVGACDMGAPHRRDRWFIVGELADDNGHFQQSRCFEGSEKNERIRDGCSYVADDHGSRQQQPGRTDGKIGRWAGDGGEAVMVDADGTGREKQCFSVAGSEELASFEYSGGRCSQSGVVRGVHGLSSRLDGSGRFLWPCGPGGVQHDWEPERTVSYQIPGRRSRIMALGNAVSPAQAYPIFKALAARVRGELGGAF